MLVGYARVSTLEQNLELQEDALTKAGCERMYTDRISGAKSERPGLKQALEVVRGGDVLVVWKLDRLGRSLPTLIETGLFRISRETETGSSASGSLIGVLPIFGADQR